MPGLSEESLDRKRVVIRLPIKIYKQVLRKFAQDGDAGARPPSPAPSKPS